MNDTHRLRIGIITTHNEYDNFVEDFLEINKNDIIEDSLYNHRLRSLTTVRLKGDTYITIIPFSEHNCLGRRFNQIFITNEAFELWESFISNILFPCLCSYPFDFSSEFAIQFI